MPYITPEERKQLFLGKKPSTPGQLNYVITLLALKLKDYPVDLRRGIRDAILEYLGGRASYTLFNEVMGVLECARLEFLRRVGYDVYINDSFDSMEKWLYTQFIGPYEDKKKEENGDVYD